MTHFLVTHIGAEPSKRFLAKPNTNAALNIWASNFHATRFKTLEQAQNASKASRLNTRVLWVDESHPAKWGEVCGQYEIVR